MLLLSLIIGKVLLAMQRWGCGGVSGQKEVGLLGKSSDCKQKDPKKHLLFRS